MTKSLITKVLIVLLLILAIGAGIYLFSTYTNNTMDNRDAEAFVATTLPPDHLIPAVPYHGQYLGGLLSSQESTSVKSILSYWNDTSVSDETLLATFEPTSADAVEALTIFTVADFFRSRGYEARVSKLTDPQELKSLIANNIPVYVQQYLSLEDELGIYSKRVYIGYDDVRQVFITHDNNFGNNYEISYAQFALLSDETNRFLAVMPAGYDLQEEPSLPSANAGTYPDRLNIMDDLALRDIQIKIMQVNYYINRFATQGIEGATESVALLEEILAHRAFDELHPAARVQQSYLLTSFYTKETPNRARAIEILETITIPLLEQYDFSQPFGEWGRVVDPSVYASNPFWSAFPWTRLGYFYLEENETEKARQAFTKALELFPEYPLAKAGLSQI